ncbi:MAG: ATP-binding protein [Mariprofundaceae bacterium]
MSVLNSTIDGIIIMRKNGKIAFSNDAADKMFGYISGELIDCPIEVLIPASMKLSHIAQREAYAKQPSRRLMNQGKRFTGLRKDGSEFPMAISLNPTLIDGEACISASVQDLTQLELEAERREKSQKLEALGEMVSGIAHNFNNVIAGIKGQSYLLHRQEDLSKKGAQRVGMIDDLCDQAADIIKQLLIYARHQDDNFQSFELIEAISDMVKMAKVSLPENIVFSYQAPKSPLFVHGMKTQIQQTILNLINNAVYAIGDIEGKVCISVMVCCGDTCTLSQCDERNKDANVCIRVQDSGKGIAVENVERVFDPFFTTKPHGEGTGLGLSTSYGIVKKHGGEISVSSKKNQGSLFQIYLPLAQQYSVPDAVSVLSPVLAANAALILVVDDEKSIVNLLTEILTGLGYKVLSAYNGEEGVQLFTEHQHDIDLVMSDIAMPKLDGVGMLHKITAIKPDMAFLFMTGYQDKSVGKELCNQYELMLKPFDFVKMSHVIRNILRNR